ncbi:MAG: hypothetical protein KTR32_15100 [Granulosicoccus sp.]|nr:hypothetical protein [Granulosicoccus sp.]
MTMDSIGIVLTITVAAFIGILGYAIGIRNARIVSKRMTQRLNAQSLELLDVKASLSEIQETTRNQPRRERLLQLVLSRLQTANRHIKALKTQQQARDKAAFVELAKLRLKAVESQEKAERLAQIARTATIHLKRLEQASPVTQTIDAPEPKSYGNGEPVKVSVVDQNRLDGTAEPLTKVSNRDSARLSKLHSSNEASAAS